MRSLNALVCINDTIAHPIRARYDLLLILFWVYHSKIKDFINIWKQEIPETLFMSFSERPKISAFDSVFFNYINWTLNVIFYC